MSIGILRYAQNVEPSKIVLPLWGQNSISGLILKIIVLMLFPVMLLRNNHFTGGQEMRDSTIRIKTEMDDNYRKHVVSVVGNLDRALGSVLVKRVGDLLLYLPGAIELDFGGVETVSAEGAENCAKIFELALIVKRSASIKAVRESVYSLLSQYINEKNMRVEKQKKIGPIALCAFFF